jgi:8-oxo-dGTP diphosphatase
MPAPHTVLAKGPWEPARVTSRWLDEQYVAPARHNLAADAAIERLKRRGSPSHDGLSARLAGYSIADGALELELQPLRWSLRLVPRDASQAISALLVVRDTDGRWLAGRRAKWLATWAGRWSLGAGGAVEVGENPVHTLTRELEEEWSVRPQRIDVRALVLSTNNNAMLLGQAWLAEGAQVTPDHEHDEFAWWPADVGAWPRAGNAELLRMAALVS